MVDPAVEEQVISDAIRLEDMVTKAIGEMEGLNMASWYMALLVVAAKIHIQFNEVRPGEEGFVTSARGAYLEAKAKIEECGCERCQKVKATSPSLRPAN